MAKHMLSGRCRVATAEQSQAAGLDDTPVLREATAEALKPECASGCDLRRACRGSPPFMSKPSGRLSRFIQATLGVKPATAFSITLSGPQLPCNTLSASVL